MNYSKGITWFDDCRIPFVDGGDIPNDMDKTHLEGRNFYTQIYNGFMYKQNQEGRFPPNLLVSDDMLNDGSISEAKYNKNYKWNNTTSNSEIFKGRGKYTPRNDKGSNSRYYDIDAWFNNLINNIY